MELYSKFKLMSILIFMWEMTKKEKKTFFILLENLSLFDFKFLTLLK